MRSSSAGYQQNIMLTAWKTSSIYAAHVQEYVLRSSTATTRYLRQLMLDSHVQAAKEAAHVAVEIVVTHVSN